MRVTHLSHTDGEAGAGRAAYRIHAALRELGVDSRMLVSQKRTTDPSVHISDSGHLSHLRVRVAEYLEARAGRALARDASIFLSPAYYGYFHPAHAALVREADIVATYWINGTYIGPESLAEINKPLVWRLSDVWPFTTFSCLCKGGPWHLSFLKVGLYAERTARRREEIRCRCTGWDYPARHEMVA